MADGTAVGSGVAVGETVLTSLRPLPHPALGSIAKPNATIASSGRRRTILRVMLRARTPCHGRALRTIGRGDALIVRMSNQPRRPGKILTVNDATRKRRRAMRKSLLFSIRAHRSIRVVARDSEGSHDGSDRDPGTRDALSGR